MLKRIIRNQARTKISQNKLKIRNQILGINQDDLNTILAAINANQNIISYIPQNILDQLKGKGVYFNALADVDFILGLTDEILPEYSGLLKSKREWVSRQIELLRGII